MYGLVDKSGPDAVIDARPVRDWNIRNTDATGAESLSRTAIVSR